MKKYLNLREARQNRHTQLWSIIRFAVAYDSLLRCEDFYEYRQSLADFNEARENLTNNPAQGDLFKIAVRFLKMKYHLEECDHAITDEEQLLLFNWEKLNLDCSSIVSNVATAYKVYWDDVLASYKRPSSRSNRIKYLIQKLEEFAEWPELKAVDGAITQIQTLHKHYADMLL